MSIFNIISRSTNSKLEVFHTKIYISLKYWENTKKATNLAFELNAAKTVTFISTIPVKKVSIIRIFINPISLKYLGWCNEKFYIL